MSITDELRKYADELDTAASRKSEHGFSPVSMKLTAIADHIDAEYQKAIRELNNLADASVLLPRDADGVRIRVGDVLTDGEYTFVVDQLAVFGDGSWSIRNEDENAWKACDVTHHHKPTVEEVLLEFANRVCNSGHQWGLDAADTIAEFAAKLRLAEEGE